jgi:iron(II)-dependent oxidoreductase
MKSWLPSASRFAFGAAAPASIALGLSAGLPEAGAVGAAVGLGVFGWLTVRNRFAGARTVAAEGEKQSAIPFESAPSQAAVLLDEDDPVRLAIEQGRFTLLLRPQVAASLTGAQLTAAQLALDEQMAVVPSGPVVLHSRRRDETHDQERSRHERRIDVEGFFLDRYPVTNAQYAAFVASGGYEEMGLWEEAIWPAVLGFVDETGQPGPRYWSQGAPPAGKDNHPVTGVCWFEAQAYARWAGKRLPSDPEWVKAAAWPVEVDGVTLLQRRYPWGDAMDRSRAHLWQPGVSGTEPVDARPTGSSVGGVEGLVGNVWEWTSTAFGVWDPPGQRIETAAPLRSVRGGAFDTYFDAQCHNQFQSGEHPLSRQANIGFRCAVGFCDVETSAAADKASGAPACAGEDSDSQAEAGDPS